MVEAHRIVVRRHARYFVEGQAATAPRELWYLLHGYGQLAEGFLAEFGALRAADRLLVAPEGLSRFYVKSSEGRVGASWMTKEAREEEIADTLDYLDAVHSAVLESLEAGTGQELATLPVHVLGFSQGAAAACRWAALGRARIARVISWAGGFPPDLEAERWPGERTRLVLVAGDSDPWVEEARVAEEVTRLTRLGIPHELKRFAGAHELDPKLLGRLAEEAT